MTCTCIEHTCILFVISAFGLNDSPVGLAAYILEKFGAGTNLEKHLSSLDGATTEKFTLDELLTDVMIYWVTGSIGSSMRFYRENLAGSEEMDAWEMYVSKTAVR